MPVWQSIYEELRDQNFEIIFVAQDTDGPKADALYEQANVTYTAIVDTTHKISSLYNFVNVPSGAWIDEEGKIVRINEGTYAKKHGNIGTDDYVIALRDWIANGKDSQYVWDEDKVAEKIKGRDAKEAKGEPAFKLANYFFLNGKEEKAQEYWVLAQELEPDNINYLRQGKAVTEEGSAGAAFFQKVQEFRQRGKDYYEPLELEEEPQEEEKK